MVESTFADALSTLLWHEQKEYIPMVSTIDGLAQHPYFGRIRCAASQTMQADGDQLHYDHCFLLLPHIRSQSPVARGAIAQGLLGVVLH